MLSLNQIHWIAGLLEGEGSFSYVYHKGANPRISVQMTDLDVLEKFRDLVNPKSAITTIGKVNGKEHWKVCYGISIYGKLSIGLMMTLYSLMSKRKKASIRTIIELWKDSSRNTLAQENRGQEMFRKLLEKHNNRIQ